jgi:deoxyribodipyrimidine photo-lyase
MTHLVWIRNDLRLRDHPALHAAVHKQVPTAVVFIGTSEDAEESASRWWLHHSLAKFDASLKKIGASLTIRTGLPEQELVLLARALDVSDIFWNRAYDPLGKRQDDAVVRALYDAGIKGHVFATANYLTPPEEVLNKAGEPFKVFTPFYKRNATQRIRKTLPAPEKMISPNSLPSSLALDDLHLLSKHDWTAGLAGAWRPGEEGAHEQLELFLEDALAEYASLRDFPAESGVSRLSPHLHFGEISPATILVEVQNRCENKRDGTLAFSAQSFIRQLYWREFANYLLHYFPHLETDPMRHEFLSFPWRDSADSLQHWRRGETGYPIVDAGMRELWHTGWMHNRVRMITASFLTKHLLIPWQRGAEWFRNTLVDADMANNTLGWQWVSGCGPDAAPYFRIFNPVLQGQKFDPNGRYVKRWIPELAALEPRYIHAPWAAPREALRHGNIRLGKEYPLPLIEHATARQRALEAFASIRR